MLAFETCITLKDHSNKNCYVFLRTTFYRLYAFFVVTLSILYFIMLILRYSYSFMDLIWIVVLIFVLTRYIFLKIPKVVCIKRSEIKKDFPKNLEYVFQGEGFRIKTEATEYFVKWSEITSIKETQDYIFFYGKDNYWFAVYKNLISSEVLSSIKSFILENPELSAKFIPYDEKIKESFWISWVSKI